ncbi:protein kinase domain-containing protein [Nocardiopsis coralliicola]
MPTDNGTRIVAERYRLDGELGRGGMGTVWRAWDTQLQRAVALKEIFLPHRMSDRERAEARARVFREARTAARVPHPAVVTMHDVFDFEDNPWVVMEILPGRALDDILAEGPMPAADVAAMARPLLDGLREAHARGVVHRDIKPGNIMIDEGGRVAITDFGIATAEGDTTITGTGALVGSPEYMPPERLESQPATPAGDLWSVGVTLYAALAGTSPFRRTTLTSTIAAVISGPIAPLPQAGPLEELLARLLERNPDERADAASALRILDGLPPISAQAEPVEAAEDGPGAAGAAAIGTAGAGLTGVRTPAEGSPAGDTRAGGPDAASAAGVQPAGSTPAHGAAPPPFGPTGGTPAHGAPTPFSGPPESTPAHGGPAPFGGPAGAPTHGGPPEGPHGPTPSWGPQNPLPGPQPPGFPGPVHGPPPGWPGQAPLSGPGAPPPVPHQQAPRKKNRALPVVLGVGGCGLVLALIAVLGIGALFMDGGGPGSTTPVEPSEEGTAGQPVGSQARYSNIWLEFEHPSSWDADDGELDFFEMGTVYFSDAEAEREMSVNTYDAATGPGSLTQLESDEEDDVSHGGFQDFETHELEEVEADHLPDGWGSYDVAVFTRTYTDEGLWEHPGRYVEEYNVIVDGTGYAIELNVPVEEKEEYTEQLEYSLHSMVLWP